MAESWKRYGTIAYSLYRIISNYFYDWYYIVREAKPFLFYCLKTLLWGYYIKERDKNWILKWNQQSKIFLGLCNECTVKWSRLLDIKFFYLFMETNSYLTKCLKIGPSQLWSFPCINHRSCHKNDHTPLAQSSWLVRSFTMERLHLVYTRTCKCSVLRRRTIGSHVRATTCTGSFLA